MKRSIHLAIAAMSLALVSTQALAQTVQYRDAFRKVGPKAEPNSYLNAADDVYIYAATAYWLQTYVNPNEGPLDGLDLTLLPLGSTTLGHYKIAIVSGACSNPELGISGDNFNLYAQVCPLEQCTQEYGTYTAPGDHQWFVNCVTWATEHELYETTSGNRDACDEWIGYNFEAEGTGYPLQDCWLNPLPSSGYQDVMHLNSVN
jgi:hypothetical protein